MPVSADDADQVDGFQDEAAEEFVLKVGHLEELGHGQLLGLGPVGATDLGQLRRDLKPRNN